MNTLITPYILVLNCGSSSIKFSVVDPNTEKALLFGLIDNVGEKATFSFSYANKKSKHPLAVSKYNEAVLSIFDLIDRYPEIKEKICAVGHRVVHGGENFSESILISKEVMKTIKDCIPLAPLHNPVNLEGIQIAQQRYPNLPQVAVFDTAFHQTQPPRAYVYPLPYEFYEKDHIRRYGFHGTSHRYVSQKAADLLGKPYETLALITAHLGNGCSITAIQNGKSIDTSMGFTTIEGLVMGKRCGDIDPSIPMLLIDKYEYTTEELSEILNKKSGLLGLSGISHDMREIVDAAEQGHQRAQLAIDIFCYRLAKYVGALAVPLGRLDALVFTGGIGENAVVIRRKVLNWLSVLNFKVDDQKNSLHGEKSHGVITTDDSRVAMVIPTNEELLIAQDTFQLIGKMPQDI